MFDYEFYSIFQMILEEILIFIGTIFMHQEEEKDNDDDDDDDV